MRRITGILILVPDSLPHNCHTFFFFLMNHTIVKLWVLKIMTLMIIWCFIYGTSSSYSSADNESITYNKVSPKKKKKLITTTTTVQIKLIRNRPKLIPKKKKNLPIIPFTTLPSLCSTSSSFLCCVVCLQISGNHSSLPFSPEFIFIDLGLLHVGLHEREGGDKRKRKKIWEVAAVLLKNLQKSLFVAVVVVSLQGLKILN